MINNYSIHNIPKLQFKLKKKYKSIIPLRIFQKWNNPIIPPLLKNNIKKIKKKNPEFKYYIFNDNDCKRFIKNHFDPDVLNAYNTLIPLAYKSDLWRYCILYIYGGIYMDMRYELVNNFKLIALTEKEHFSLERKGFWSPGKHGIYNALIVVKKENPFLLKCIEEIVDNVKNRYYGFNSLYPTGPGLLWLIHEEDESLIGNNIDIFFPKEGKNLIYNNRIILHSMNGYENIRNKHILYYNHAWIVRNIYKED